MIRSFSIVVFLFVCFDLMAIKPYYNFGIYYKSVETLRGEVKKVLIDGGFDVIGIYSPGDTDSLSVIVFTCDELTSLATGVANKGTFGSTMKIGLIGDGKRTKITMLNPFYFITAYLNGKANNDAIQYITNRVDSLAKKALSTFSKYPVEYGVDIEQSELRSYRFLPSMAGFEDVIKLKEFESYTEAVKVVKANLIKSVDGSEMVYELNFHDKEVAIFGISFGHGQEIENKLLKILGVNNLSSLPIEILIQDNKAYILNPKYRIPVFKPELSVGKYFRISGLSSEIRTVSKDIVCF